MLKEIICAIKAFRRCQESQTILNEQIYRFREKDNKVYFERNQRSCDINLTVAASRWSELQHKCLSEDRK